MRELISVKSQLSTLKSKARGADYMREIGSLPDLAKIYFFLFGFSFTNIYISQGSTGGEDYFQFITQNKKALSPFYHKKYF